MITACCIILQASRHIVLWRDACKIKHTFSDMQYSLNIDIKNVHLYYRLLTASY